MTGCVRTLLNWNEHSCMAAFQTVVLDLQVAATATWDVARYVVVCDFYEILTF